MNRHKIAPCSTCERLTNTLIPVWVAGTIEYRCPVCFADLYAGLGYDRLGRDVLLFEDRADAERAEDWAEIVERPS